MIPCVKRLRLSVNRSLTPGSWIKSRGATLLLVLAAMLATGLLWTNTVSADVDFLTQWGSAGAANGQFNGPFGVAVDSSGNVYVTDSGNSRIQKFNSSGTFIIQWGTHGSGNGQFDSPIGIAVDISGNVYVADVNNNRIQKFNSSGTYISQFGTLGSGDGQLHSPYGVAIDLSGNIYVADSSNHRIQKFDPSGTFITKWGTHGGGNSQFDNPRGLAVDLAGNVYVADVGNTRIEKFDSSGTYLTQWGGEGTGKGQFEFVAGVIADAWGYVYVTDASNNNIQKFTSTGSFVTRWGTSGSGAGQLNAPFGVSIDTLGNVYVADSANNRIQKFGCAPEEYFTLKWGQPGSSPGTFNSPVGVAVDSSDNIYVVDQNNTRIEKFTATGTFITQWGSFGTGDGQFQSPWGIALDSANNVYVTDIFNARVQKFTSSGAFISKWNTGGSISRGIAVDRLGNVYVSDEGNNCIRKFNSSGSLLTQWGSTGSANGQFMVARAIAVDFAGNVYAADIGNARIQKFDSAGNFITKWGSLGSGPGQMFNMIGLGVDAAGNVYVGDTGNSPTNNNNNRIEKFTPSGTFVLQWGSHGSTDGQFQVPFQPAVDASGNVYVADVLNERIQKFSQGSPVASAGSDQTFTCVQTATQTVTLNGTSTTDPTPGDVAALDYQWSEGTTLLGTGASLTLPFTPGVHTVTVAVTDDCNHSSIDTVVITVAAYDHATCNTAPDAIDDAATIDEDSGANVISVRSNDTDFDNDTLNITAVTQGTNGSVAITGGGTGLSYTPGGNYNGPDAFTYTISDGHGGSDTASVSVTVNAVNDTPSFTKGSNQTANAGAGAQTVTSWATNILAGPLDESSQTLNFIVANDNNGIFSVQPAIGANGTLTYTPAANAVGSALVFVQVHDSGGTAHNGVDTSTAQTFTVTVISPANVSGQKTVSGTFAPGGSVIYNVVLSNAGPAAQLDNSGDECTDMLPAGLTLVSANATNGTAVPTIATNTVTWNGSIAASSSVTITVTAIINSNAGGTIISNQGSISYDADGNGTNEASRLTDDPSTGAANDATSFAVCSNNPVVTSNADSGPGSLRQAIAGVCPAGTITFDMNQVASPITLTSGELVIDKNLTINGPGADLLTLDANNASRLFNIFGGVTVNLTGMKLFRGNAGAGNSGGAIMNSGTLNASSLLVETCSATLRGGCITNAGTLTLNNSTVRGGGAQSGGGIYTAPPATLLTINNSTINGNKAGDGGGLFIANPANLNNSTISGNSTDTTAYPAGQGNGGGIGMKFDPLTTFHTTITNNTANTSGGGVFVFNSQYAIHNDLVAGNNAPAGPDVFGQLTSFGYNLIGDTSGNFFNASPPVGSTLNGNILNVPALLAPLGDYGSATQTHALLWNSLALNAGDPSVFLPTDERGLSRPAVSQDDIGAYERQSPEMRATPTGSNVANYFGDVTITFPSVSVSGNTTLTDTTSGTLPNGYLPCPGCAAFDISTNATFSGPVNLCFFVPAVSAADLPNLKVLHDAGSGLTDNGTSHVNVANRQVCGQANSFSPFVIAKVAAPTAAPAAISGRVISSAGLPLGGVVITLSGPRQLRAITNSSGYYEFDDLDTQVFYTVTPQIANYSFTPQNRSFSLLGNRTDATFTAVIEERPSANPLDTEMFFVRQQYLDFLSREPDPGGLDYWTDEIEKCGADPVCVNSRRVEVSAAFFIEAEFQLKGFYVYRVYQGALGRRPSYAEFMTDRGELQAHPNLDLEQVTYTLVFVQRAEFIDKYQSALNGPDFVAALIQNVQINSGVDLTPRHNELLAAYDAGSNQSDSRARTLQALVDQNDFRVAEYNRGFVLAQYFGYLRREPDTVGYDFWLNALNSDPNNFQGMVCSFMTSAEYQDRFGPVRTHSNPECSGSSIVGPVAP
jgi:DNA-binding beta-propeller fold protein YncE